MSTSKWPSRIWARSWNRLGARRGLMINMRHGDGGIVYLQYKVPTRGLLGFRSDFLTLTRGTGIMHALFLGYEPLAGEINTREHGSLVAWEPGVTTGYGLKNAEERGSLFIGAGRRSVRRHGGGPAHPRYRSDRECLQEEASDQHALVDGRHRGAPDAAARR